MPEHPTSFVANITRTLYGFEPQSIEALDQHPFDWRGIYRLRDAQGDEWLMRLAYPAEQADCSPAPLSC